MATVFNTVRISTDYARTEQGDEVVWVPETVFEGYQVVRDGYEYGLFDANGGLFTSKKSYEAAPIEGDVPTPAWWVEP